MIIMLAYNLVRSENYREGRGDGRGNHHHVQLTRTLTTMAKRERERVYAMLLYTRIILIK